MPMMDFQVIGKITDIETIAVGNAIRELPSLQKRYGRGRWRKLKGVATVRLFIVRQDLPKYIGTKHTASAERE